VSSKRRASARPELDPAAVDEMLTSIWQCVERGEHFTLDMYAEIVRMAREQGYV
jgi:hypothetical protein